MRPLGIRHGSEVKDLAIDEMCVEIFEVNHEMKRADLPGMRRR
jgi:hypothetical protein